jgi:hypothetical protein
MTQKLGWKLAVLVLLCVTVSSGTAQFGRRGRWGRRNKEAKEAREAREKWVKETRKLQSEQQAYKNGQVFVYLTPEGKLKRVATKSADVSAKTKLTAQELYQTKQQAYTQAKGRFLERNPEQKYAPLKPFKPEFIALSADIVYHTERAPTLVPKEHYYGLYKVGVDGKVKYEAGYAFSDAAQQIKYLPKYFSKYNLWIRKLKSTTEPVEPVFEKLGDRMTQSNAQRAAAAMTTWNRQYDLWVKRGSKPNTEPKKPNVSIYQAAKPREEKRPDRRRRPNKDQDKAEEKEKPEPEEKKETPKTKKDAGWS